MIQNPKTANWTNPTTGQDMSGASVAWSAATDQAAMAVSFDGGAAIQVAVAAGATSLDLTKIPAYMTLANGQHTMTIAEVTKEGATGGTSAVVTFLIATIPAQPTLVSVS